MEPHGLVLQKLHHSGQLIETSVPLLEPRPAGTLQRNTKQSLLLDSTVYSTGSGFEPARERRAVDPERLGSHPGADFFMPG